MCAAPCRHCDTDQVTFLAHMVSDHWDEILRVREMYVREMYVAALCAADDPRKRTRKST